MESNLPIKLVSMPGPKSIHSINNIHKVANKCLNNCEVCNALPDKYNCKIKNVVYKFTCTICTDREEAYIGRTSRTLSERYKEHADALHKASTNSALSEHWIKCHNNLPPNMIYFSLNIIKILQRPILSAIVEAQAIEQQQPSLNRKHEVTIL